MQTSTQPTLTLQPTTPEQVQELILEAVGTSAPLEIIGAGTKRSYGRPVVASRTLSLAGLRGIVDYQPTELVLVVRPGTPLVEVEATLDARGQMLAFEPPTWDARATLGGVVACNLSGPRRFKAGAVRDHLLGFQAVTGRGELIRGGGRVVKNVTGYDMSKLMCGSFGTLAVLTELCLKVLPRPAGERTVAVMGLDDAEALELMLQAGRSEVDVSGMAHLCADTLLPPALAGAVGSIASVTLLRVGGPRESVLHRSERLVTLANRQTLFLDDADSAGLWRAVRELEPLPPAPEEYLWRISVAFTRAAALAQELRRLGPSRTVYDWGGALIWHAQSADANPRSLHKTVRQAGGHARLQRCLGTLPESFPAFTALAPGVELLNRNLKLAFDPQGVLNPGRMYRGW